MFEFNYTTFGEIYVGEESFEPDFPNHKVIIQRSKAKEYFSLSPESKSPELIKQFGWIVPKLAITKVTDGSELSDIKRGLTINGLNSSFEYNTMFVFGAGASANCVGGLGKENFEKSQWRPPLGIELFKNRFESLYEAYPGVLDALPELQDDYGLDLEGLFEDEWQSISNYNNLQVLRRHINIQFYLRELLMKVSEFTTSKFKAQNLYGKFALKLQKIQAQTVRSLHGGKTEKRFTCVSFNQDTILDHFISRIFNIDFNSMNDYVNNSTNPCMLLKPHGSWNWGWKFKKELEYEPSRYLYDHNIMFDKIYYNLLGSPAELVDSRTWGPNMFSNPHGVGHLSINKSKISVIHSDEMLNTFPALLIPYRDKDEFTFPLEHLFTLETFFGNLKTLVLIGWKGNEAQFNRLLSKATKVKRVIVADPRADDVKGNILKHLPNMNVKSITYKSFEEFVQNGLTDDLLL